MCKEHQTEGRYPPPTWKNWEGKKVNTISASHVEYVEFERFPVSDDIIVLESEISVLEREMTSSQDELKITQLTRMKKLLDGKKFKCLLSFHQYLQPAMLRSSWMTLHPHTKNTMV